MAALVLDANLADVDDVYQWLVDAHAGRSDVQSMRLNAKLILLLANHIGDRQVIREAIDRARFTRGEEASQPCT